MIRKGQQAKVTYSKKASCSKPVKAKTKSPGRGKTEDGTKHARTVSKASVSQVVLQDGSNSRAVQKASVSSATTTAAVSVKPLSCRKTEPEVHSKTVQNVSKDITINNVFQQ